MPDQPGAQISAHSAALGVALRAAGYCVRQIAKNQRDCSVNPTLIAPAPSPEVRQRLLFTVLHVFVAASETGEDDRLFAVHEMTAVEFGRNMNGERAVPHGERAAVVQQP